MTRAITEEAKKEKSEFIIDQAFLLFEEKSFREFKMDELAKACDFSKGIIFKYFHTKEMLFLSMLIREYNMKLERVLNRLLEIEDHSLSLEDIKPILLESLREDLYYNKNYLRLLSIKCSILEHNISYDFAKEYKIILHENFNFILNYLARKIDYIGQEILRNVLTVMDSIVEGYLSKIVADKIIDKVVENENLYQFQIDYREHAITTYDYYLTTFIAKNKKR